MLEKQTLSPKKPGHGHEGVVDVVLGAQWGDEGKGKLVRAEFFVIASVLTPAPRPLNIIAPVRRRCRDTRSMA